MKKESGITLAMLVVMIIIMLLLAGIAISGVSNDNGVFKRMQKITEEEKEKAKSAQDDITYLEEDLENLPENEIKSKWKGANPPKLSDGMIPIKYDNSTGKWVITNENDDNWYSYTEEDKKWANVMLSDGKYKKALKNYKTDGTTTVEENELGSMFVWIPRFAYSIKEYHKESVKEEGTTQGITDVTFLYGTGNKDIEGTTYETTYSLDEMDTKVGQATPKIVHPAFKNTRGIWVAKFEASMEGTNENTDTANDKVISNKIRVLPNAETWRYISIGNSFLNCFNMKDSGNVYGLNGAKADTHLIKNTEWGAVAYLAASQYGVVPTINNKVETTASGSTTIYHSYAGGKDYKANKSQSTTGNVTGIYDMCGGGWEFVAAYYDNKTEMIKTYGKEVFDDNKKAIDKYKDYWEEYEVGEKEKTDYVNLADLWDKDSSFNSERMKITKERYEKMKNYIGDAMYEVIGTKYSFFGQTTSEDYTWMTQEASSSAGYGIGFYNRNYALIGNCAQSFVLRGGAWAGTSGVFAMENWFGRPTWDNAFRPVILV